MGKITHLTPLFLAIAAAQLVAVCGQAQLLSTYIPVQGNSWDFMEANSERNNALYIGAKPRDMVIYGKTEARPKLPLATKALLQAQVKVLIQGLKLKNANLEAWPVENDEGDYTWAFARYQDRDSAKPDEWNWFKSLEFTNSWAAIAPAPELPVTKNLAAEKSFKEVFDDFLDMSDLYAKPLFGNAVFTDSKGKVLSAWLPTEHRALLRARFLKKESSRKNIVARILSQPARFNDRPTSFLLKIVNSELQVPTSIQWLNPVPVPVKSVTPVNSEDLQFAESMKESYQQDVAICAGEKIAQFPLSEKKLLLKRKNNAQTDNQLYDNAATRDSDRVDFASYLIERYKVLGLKTWEQKFQWRGFTHSNVVAIIKGSLPKPQNQPILLADHFDTAFEEDSFQKTNKRVSSAGADDNCTATAGLLAAAEILRHTHPAHDIWLVHLTGEEFPADDLGVRQLLPVLLKNKVDVQAVLLMDMIGNAPKRGRIFQISAGESVESHDLARLAVQVSNTMIPARIPKLRERFNLESYLYNTDGRVISAIGYPVILFNEHLNRGHGIDRKGYHDTEDVSRNLDFDYATDILKVVIGTAHSLAQDNQ